MKRHIRWAFMGLAICTTAWAQEAPPAPDQAPAQQQAPGGNRRGQRRVRPGMGGPGMMGRDLTQVLNLTPEQQKQVQEIYQKIREENQQQGGGFQRNPQDREKMRELRQQLDEAAKAGDDAKVEQLRTELQNTGFGQWRQQQAKAYDQIEQILTPEQKVTFKEWRTLQDSGVPPYLLGNPEAFQKAVLRISTLTDVQKNQFEAIFERYNRDAASPAATTESKQASALKMASEVVKQLKPSQTYLLAGGGRMMQRPGGRRQPSDVGNPANSTGGAAGNGSAGNTPAAGQ